MKQRRDTFANWAAENPVLLDGELGIVSDDPNLYKVGDGSTAWNALPFRGFDGTLAQELGTSPNAVISQKVVSEKLSELSERINNLPQGDQFDKEGNYPLLHVGTADDLAGRGESVPASFGFRASGGKSIKDGRAYIKRIKGNSVVWNQLAHSFDENHWRNNNTNYHDLSFDNGVAIATAKDVEIPYNYSWSIASRGEIHAFYANHKYLIALDYYESVALKGTLYLYAAGDNTRFTYTHTNDWQTLSKIYTPSTNSTATYLLFYSEVVPNTNYNGEVWKLRNFRIIDLTQMFGAEEAAKINTIEDYNARKPIVANEYAYNEGQVIHCNTESIKSVGDNAWDEEWEVGGIGSNGQPNTTGNRFRSKNFIRAIPNQTYTATKRLTTFYYDEGKNIIKYEDIIGKQFTTPTNCAYIKFYYYGTEVYDNDIMITLMHSGWKQDTDAGYQPYWQDTLPLPIIRKYFPQGMKSAGTAHDEIRYNKASGKWEKVVRIGSVDMGSMAWSYDSANQVFTSYTIMDLMTHPAEVSERNKGLLCSKYSPSSTYVASTMDDKSWLRIPKSVTIKDTSYTDATSFKASLQGVMLYYELAEPIVTELDAEDQNFRDYYNVADFGTEEAIPATDAEGNIIPSANFSADIIYQFNAVDMIREHEIEINELQSIIATMQAQLASLTNKE